MARKLLLTHIDVPGINTFEVYRQKGGYAAVEKAIKRMSPEDVVEEVKKIWITWKRWSWVPNRNEMVFFGQAGRGATLFSL